MHNVKKNQIVVVLLVVMIVVAGYLNYRTEDANQLAMYGEDSVYSTQQISQITGEMDMTAEGVLIPDGMEEINEENVEDKTAEESGKEATETAADLSLTSDEETEEARMPGEAILVESDAIVPEYFAEAKVERENARAKSQDMLYDLMAKNDTPEEEKSEAAQKILELQKRIENEAAAEAMIKAKGFDETYVRIYDDCVDVIVDRQEITQQEAAQIQDILTRITGLGAEKIRISLLKIAQ